MAYDLLLSGPIRRAVLHEIHSIFPSPAIFGDNGDELVSVKKLLEEEGLWEV